MSDFVRRQLIELVAEQGPSISEDARRCEAFLNDRCRNDRKREIFVLVNAIVQRIPSDLRVASMTVPSDVLLVRFTDRLVGNLGLTQRLAAWAVSSWAVALNVPGAEGWDSAWQPTGDNPFEEETSLSAVEMLRQAVRKVLEDNVVTDEERDELRALARTLGVAPELAAHIFTEELDRRRNPPPKPQPQPQPPPPPPKRRLHPVVWAIVVVAAVPLLVLLARQFSGPHTQRSQQTETRYTTRPAAVRDKATTAESQILRKLDRGEFVSGTWLAPDKVHRWLQIGNGQFVSEINLSDRPRPKIVRTIDADDALIQPSLLYREADSASGSIKEMKIGDPVHVYAEVEGGWMEIQRQFGGVGYVPPLALQKAVPKVNGCVAFTELYQRAVCGNAALSALDHSMRLAYRDFVVLSDDETRRAGEDYMKDADRRQHDCGSNSGCLTGVLVEAKQYFAIHTPPRP